MKIFGKRIEIRIQNYEETPHLLRRLDEIRTALFVYLRQLAEVEKLLFRRRSATLTIEGLMASTLTVGKTATAVLHEFEGLNGTGAELPPIGPVAYTSSDPSIASVDMASGLVTALKPGSVTITGTDAGNSLTASDTQPVAAPTAQSATLVITPN